MATPAISIGVVHGHDGTGRSTLARAQNAFAGERVSAILFGHSHIPYSKQHDGILCFNPGSPTDRRRQPAFSYGIIRIVGTTLEPRLFYSSDKSP